MLNADMIYEAADYLRLSKEDGDFSLSNDKLESDSISSQRAIIERFVAQNPNIKLVAEFCDDGYTGTNFDRPDFQRMMFPDHNRNTLSVSANYRLKQTGADFLPLFYYKPIEGMCSRA